MEQRGFVFHAENLLSPDEAIATFLARVSLTRPRLEHVSLDDAHGRILGQRIVADRDYPMAARSAMDGFAVHAVDAPGTLSVVGDLAMGTTWNRPLARGTALRIPTGGTVPADADAVVPIEDAVLEGDGLRIDGRLEPGENVIPRASDMQAGELVLEPGTRLSATHAGLLATLGVTSVPVYARPRIAIVSSGDELVAPETEPKIGQIRDSNRYAIAATLRALGAEPLHRPTVGDAPGELEAALRAALDDADAACVTGGSSVGERDQTPAAIEALGPPGIIVHGLRVKPGKPTVLAAIGSQPVLGLPGNPTSAVIILQAVAAPIVCALAGYRERPSSVRATLASPVRSRPGWTWYVPVSLVHEADSWAAHPLPLRSSTVSIIARADGYITLPEDVEAYPEGTDVTVTRFI